MSKFNQNQTNQAVNRAGGEAYKQSDKLELISTLLTTFLQDSFYEKSSDTLSRIQGLVRNILDKKFAAKAALFARDKCNMRSASHLVAGEIANIVHGEIWTKDFFEKIVVRPDDALEISAYYQKIFSKKDITNSMKKGFAKALQRMSAYDLAKYKSTKKDLSLYDLVNKCHPKPNEQLTSLMKGRLKAPQTWEVEISKAGNDIEKKKAAWRALVLENKLGYMALMRNLRNILEFANETIDYACEQLANEQKILKSRLLPFRFATALQEIEKLSFDNTQKVIIALSKACDIALQNVPKLEGKTLVVLDVSGSMSGKPEQIGSLFSAVLLKANAGNSNFVVFSDRAKCVQINPLDSTLSIAKSIRFAGGGTNFHSIFELITGSEEQKGNKYDRIVILSDMQGWVGNYSPKKAFETYKSITGADPMIYSFDLQNYGSMQFPEKKVWCLAGWSEQVLNVMKIAELDENSLINMVEAVDL